MQHPDFRIFFREIFLLHSWKISTVRNSNAANFENADISTFDGSIEGLRLFP
jgi:hypothetical protein